MPPADTARDSDYLSRLRDYYVEAKRIPSHQRIAALMGFASKTAAKKLLARLESAGFLERTPDDDAWMPAARFFERPLADVAVRAGAPDMIDGMGGEPFLVDQYLVRQPSRTVMVPVKGDSMIDAGIHEGDVVVVERTKAARAGDFVIAIVDNEFTLKELGLERGRFILKPHNPAYPIIRPQSELEIYGVVTGLVRRYRG
ncbi:MAG: LexA family transcriptional regulator [Gammaproteobacteria bacterium]|nr:LexA family transcriptional regulator [Rhodocyclaceae bacterium]MBU3908680.1 LexA family transcriptional regulator [Gammaproteobacteria bacterium]MBU3990770.1 LexA family transcriptional regulator [Gammaproteobacteria bacterium]MBU4004708.1 LexA family transcriptional regulator [Gammaproteobacteria bacterium]MBU4021311.1 LexA family transcriptional regulator [Gammaproteobacteria bacterium]